MKQIKLKDGVTLMAVEVDEHRELYYCSNCYHWGDGSQRCPMCGCDEHYWHEAETHGALIGNPDFTLLGTAPDFLAREDAEEVCRKYVEEPQGVCNIFTGRYIGKLYTDYTGEDRYGLYFATDSFKSALRQMGYNGEILIIKVEGEGK